MSDPVVNIIVLPATGTSASNVDVKIQLLPNTSSGAGTTTVSVLSPTDNSEQNTKALYSASWHSGGSPQTGSVDEETSYTTCSTTFSDATEAGVTLDTTNYQLVVFGKSGTAYTSANYKTLTLGASNAVTIRFEYPKDKRPAYVTDILDGNISAYAK